ncbi:MAG: TIM barrel protein [Granulicella sp.]
MTYSRRQFNKLALSSLPVAAAAISSPASIFAAGKPNSKFNGVQIGVINYSYSQMPKTDADSILSYMLENGINTLEMEVPTQEVWAGAPPPPPRPMPAPRSPAAAGAPAAPRQRMQMTPEQIAAQKAHAEELTKWRTTMDMKKYVELRKKYNDAGVTFYAFKIGLNMNMPDAEYDYAFTAAKTLGCTQLTMEMPDGNSALTARIGKFAEKHKLMVGYHAHLQAKPDTWDEAMAQSPYNGINIDMGHYTAAGNTDQIAFLVKNHARITSMHLKDRKTPANGEANMPWGEGDTPIKELLQTMKKNGYKFPATIELEYPIPEGSDSVKEVAKCLAYSKAALA